MDGWPRKIIPKVLAKEAKRVGIDWAKVRKEG